MTAQTTTRQELGAAVVGLGIGFQHALTYASLRATRLRWLYDLDPERVEESRRRLGQGKGAPDLTAILDNPDTAIVSIASFDDAHYEQVLEALKRRKHLFVEKPLCRTVEEAANVKRAWEDAGRPALDSNLVLRAAPLYRWLKEAIDAGEFGEIYAIDGDYLYGRLHKITDGWRRDVPDYSVTLGGGVHMIDLMLWFAGERPDTVSTIGNRISARGTGFRYDDFAAATFTFPSGLVGRISTNYGCVHRHHHVLRIFGTKASFIYDDAGPRLHRSRSPDERAAPVTAAPLPAAKGDLIPDFVQSILDGRDTAITAMRNFDLICTCAAAEDSLRSGIVQSIHYLG